MHRKMWEQIDHNNHSANENYSELFWRKQKKKSILKEQSQKALKFITSVQYVG